MRETKVVTSKPSCLCRGTHFRTVFQYTEPPKGETQFPFSSTGSYSRKILQCDQCGHFISLHDMDMQVLYEGEYVQATYGQRGIRQAFEQIIGLDPACSDNTGRVKRILEFAKGHFADRFSSGRPPRVLDVGSGLCVFLHRLKEAGWDGIALDPDPQAVAHARDTVGVKAVLGELMTVKGLGRFDIVTFNKMLEHVQDPVAMLSEALDHLAPEGFVYVEVPDGEAAVEDGPGREEFFIEHWHIFSSVSLALLAFRSGFQVQRLERLREPSGKFTLWAFLTPE